MYQNIKDAEEFANAMNATRESDSERYMFWVKLWQEHKIFTRAVVDSTGNVAKTQFVYGDFPDELVKFDDLLTIRDDASYNAVIEKIKAKNAAPVEETPVVSEPVPQTTPDMLVNTGKTVVMQPVNDNMQINEIPADEEKVVEPAIERAPTIKPKAKKPLSLSPKVSSQSGFAEAIVLGVIVLVYIAIIVNLIIRLK